MYNLSVQKFHTGDTWHLDEAEGWLAFGHWREANDELKQISPEARDFVQVLKVQYAAYAAARKWDRAADTARAIIARAPGISFGYFHMATALNEMHRVREAREVLLPVADKSRDWTLGYNVACCAAQLGDLQAAQAWLEKACEIAGSAKVKTFALDDPDLEPLLGKMDVARDEF